MQPQEDHRNWRTLLEPRGNLAAPRIASRQDTEDDGIGPLFQDPGQRLLPPIQPSRQRRQLEDVVRDSERVRIVHQPRLMPGAAQNGGQRLEVQSLPDVIAATVDEYNVHRFQYS